jgi:hypothetical protein
MNVKMDNIDLIEKTGYSYSGVSDLLQNEEDGVCLELLRQVDDAYLDAKNRQSDLEEELESIKRRRAYMVSMFLHVANCKNVGKGDELVFYDRNRDISIIKVIDQNKIDYEKKKITSLAQK